MTKWRIQPTANLLGSVRVPGSKSQSLRALLFAALASTPSRLKGILDSPDARAMVQGCKQMGARFEPHGAILQVEPMERLQSQSGSLLIDAGNSGIVWRFMTAIAALRPAASLITGDRSILCQRPLQPLLGALRQVGVDTWQTRSSFGPCCVKGPWRRSAAAIEIEGSDSQPVSAMLIAGALHCEPLRLQVTRPGEVPWALLTAYWLLDWGAALRYWPDGSYYEIEPAPCPWQGRDYEVPGDFSSAAFLIAAALVTRSCVSIEGLDRNDPQPDRLFVQWLEQSGASIEWHDQGLRVDGRKPFEGFELDLRGPIDLLPIAAVVACFATSPSCLKGIEGARYKESDRVTAIVQELGKMGGRMRLEFDQLTIYPSELRGSCELYSHRDHRIAMSLAVASLGARGPSQIEQVEWVSKSYGAFARDLRSLGAQVEVLP